MVASSAVPAFPGKQNISFTSLDSEIFLHKACSLPPLPIDHVLCAISGKEIQLQNLNYWNVDLQEAYYSPIEANKRFKTQKK